MHAKYSRLHYLLLKVDTSFKESSNTDDIGALFTQQSPSRIIYLKTLLVDILHKGKTRSVRALLDDGSHRSYIEKALLAELNIPDSGKEILFQGLFGGRQTPEEEHGLFNFTLESTNRSYSCQISALESRQNLYDTS
ncbi:transposable element Tc1 transposase [Nephila pilipes]|uniref:Transposable element Tc1 transposase n=1 Tax=Nephila pilipes TaxID=299642 RepID=A0A8X6T6V3_NEPPI|nr:transposable element Tc1 transposase [Nephila pilipes]